MKDDRIDIFDNINFKDEVLKFRNYAELTTPINFKLFDFDCKHNSES